jgi:hypothetical protein
LTSIHLLPRPGGAVGTSRPGPLARVGASAYRPVAATTVGRPSGIADERAARAQRRSTMPKYLFEASYTLEGAKGLIKDGGSKRRAAVEALVKGLGGGSRPCTSPTATTTSW